jgi:hypothetical protein
MAHNHLTLNGTPRDGRWRSSLHEAVSWVMILLVMLVASVGFTLDHLLPIFP